MAKVSRFEDLEMWQMARKQCNDLYIEYTKTPFSRDFELVNQISRSSGSVMDNIAEGFERGGNKEFHNYLSYSKASCGEVRSQLYRALDRKHIIPERFEHLKEQSIIISKKISAFMRYLRNSDMKGHKFK